MQANRNRNNKKKFTEKKKTKLEDFVFYIGSYKQASDYEKAKDFIINHIQMTYKQEEDIAQAFETGQYVNTNDWRPTLDISNAATAAERTRENKQFDMLYKTELDEYVKRKNNYNSNKN